jgi:hypothetical protein
MDRVQASLDAEPPPSGDDITSAFWGACHGGQREAAEVLLDRGAEVNWLPPWEGRTPLDAAKRSEASELAAWLESRGAKSATELAAG